MVLFVCLYLNRVRPQTEAHVGQARAQLRDIHLPILIHVQLVEKRLEAFARLVAQTPSLGEKHLPQGLIHYSCCSKGKEGERNMSGVRNTSALSGCSRLIP